MGLGNKVKNLLGIEGPAKETLTPMVTYSTANIGIAAGSQITGDFLLPFLTLTEGLSLGSATVMMFFRSIWDAIIDPFIGFAIDRTRSRFGKHRIYIILMAIPFGITYSMRFTSFGISSQANAGGKLWAYHLGVGMLFATVASVLDIAHESMLPTLATGYFERTQYNSMNYIMNAVGMVPAQFFGMTMVGIKTTKEFDASMRPTIFKIGLIIGLLAIIPIMLSGILTKQRSSKNDVLPPLNGKVFFQEFRQALKNRAFKQYLAMYFLYLFGSSFYTVSRPFFLREVANRWDLNSQLNLLRGGFEMAMFPINYALTKKFGKQKCATLTVPMLFICFIFGFLISPQAEGSTLLSVVIILFAREIFYIIGYAGFGFMVSNIFPDVTDVDEMITGRRREATISTFNSFVKTMTSGFMASVVGILLEWFGVAQDRTTVPLFHSRAVNLSRALTPSFGLKLSNAFLPVIFMAFALHALRKYKMNKKDHELIRRAIAQRHEQGEIELTDEERLKLEEIAGHKLGDMWLGQPAAATVEG